MKDNLIDTHAHLNFPDFEKDLDRVIKDSLKNGVTKIICVSANIADSQKAIEIAQKYEEIYAAVGIHPQEVEEIKILRYEDIRKELKRLAQKPKVIAIGECGLDYSQMKNEKIKNKQSLLLRSKNDIEKLKIRQKELFKIQLILAQELRLPVIVHCRDAQEEALQLIKLFNLTGVFHCFSGDKEFLNQVLKMGFYIGFCGNLTFKNAKSLQEAARIVPLERILLETDCPFLSPEPFRGLRNTPENVKLIGEFLAKLKGISLEQVCQITTKNAKNLFKIR
ncbi:MAG: TatD family hydrolase [Patescibacteria group bacterium]